MAVISIFKVELLEKGKSLGKWYTHLKKFKLQKYSVKNLKMTQPIAVQL